MRSYGEIEVTRSGALAIALEVEEAEAAAAVPTQGAAARSEETRFTESFWSIEWRNAFTKKTEI